MENTNDITCFKQIDGFIEAKEPLENIYDFEGTLTIIDMNLNESLSLENTLWANTVLANGKIFGL